jgi:adenosylmethionine-8-amino-7-oxononanoate aminotransferase
MIDEACHDRGLIVRPLINMCVFSPPLIISKSQVNDLFEILEQVIENICKNFDLRP